MSEIPEDKKVNRFELKSYHNAAALMEQRGLRARLQLRRTNRTWDMALTTFHCLMEGETVPRDLRHSVGNVEALIDALGRMSLTDAYAYLCEAVLGPLSLSVVHLLIVAWLRRQQGAMGMEDSTEVVEEVNQALRVVGLLD